MRALAGATAVSAVLLGAMAAAPGCGGKQGPAGPSDTKPQTLTISGATSLRQPGDTSQLTATALFTDGKTRDVTADANWTGGQRPSDGQTLVKVSRGLLTAVNFGWANVGASYLNVQAAALVRVAPEGMFFLSGHVTEGGFTVPQARVEAASSTATLSTMTGAEGSYLVPALGDATLRVEKDGYQTEVRRLMVDQDGEVNVEIQRVHAQGDIRGMWSLAIIASPSCTFAPDVMQRNYTARVDETNQGIIVDLSGSGHFGGWWATWGFLGTRDGTTLRFTLDNGGKGYDTTEEIDSSRIVWYLGTATAAPGDKKISAVFSGKVVLWTPASIVECAADNHRLEFVR